MGFESTGYRRGHEVRLIFRDSLEDPGPFVGIGLPPELRSQGPLQVADDREPSGPLWNEDLLLR